jgi:hypothetical protein
MAKMPEQLRRELDELPAGLLVDYLAKRLATADRHIFRQAICQRAAAIDLRPLFEVSPRRFNPHLTTLPCTLELRFVDGRLRWATPHATITVTKLEEFERETDVT